MGFPMKVRVSVLLKCKRHCCLCGNYAGIDMELHHIKQQADGGPDTEGNCMPLCFNCHAEVRSYNPSHPKGLKYTDRELIARRDEVYDMVKNKIIDIYNDNDIVKAKKIMDAYSGSIEYIIQLDPCGSRINIALLDLVDSMIAEFQRYDYCFENLGLDIEKCALIDALTKWKNMIMNKRYFHTIDSGRALCFNADTVNEYRERMINLRYSMRASYLKFRFASTMKKSI